MLGEPGKQEILQKMFPEHCRSQIVFRTNIFRKLTLGAPDCERKANTSQSSSGYPVREAKDPQLEMVKQPQVQRQIQANMCLFHFISLAEQSGHCNWRQAAICLPKSKPKRHRRGEYIFTTTHDRWKPAWWPCLLYKLSLTGVPHRTWNKWRCSTPVRLSF